MGPPRSAAPKSLSKVLQRLEAESVASEGAPLVLSSASSFPAVWFPKHMANINMHA